MKHNPNTRNIFTAEGRLNRSIDKHNKRVTLLKKMDEAIKQLEEKFDSMEPISIDELNKKCYPERYSETDTEECIIRCDRCSHEFDITKKEVERYEKTQKDEDGEVYATTLFVCPKCGFSNEIDSDDEESEEETIDDIINSQNNKLNDLKETITENNKSLDKLIDTTESLLKDLDIDPNVAINNTKSSDDNGNNKSNKVKPFRFIKDEEVIKGINIAILHKSVSETVTMLKDNGIDNLIKARDNDVDAYSTKSGNILFANEKDNPEELALFTINTRLMLVPHGNSTKLYNSILSQLNIEKFSNKFESIKLGGKACIIKLADDSLAACNFNITGNDLTMTFIYNIE